MDSKPTALIVEDSEAFAMYFSLVLNRLGLNVVPTKDGLEALTLLRVIRPDIVIIDAAVKERDGIKASTLVSAVEHISNVPVIITYKEENKKAFEDCVNHDHFGCLLKPVNILEFHRMVQQCVTFARNTKRRAIRTVCNKKISVKYKKTSHDYYATSLSGGGVFVRSIEPLPVGTEVEVSIEMKEGKCVNLAGTVIYQKDVYTNAFKFASGMAIEFKDLSAKTSELLKEYILNLLVGDIMEEQKNIFKLK
ncbi:MAG: hypothetical protein COW90_03710 [Nitrospirae bacterium CG22_combo_CG10-13_8_21_14_all_44_11]|nr:MAG: hypothetical protein COW90_03710 [Nitrospirae bacterium CG22_combo_CG10-13_8_21_14_all_44_11]